MIRVLTAAQLADWTATAAPQSRADEPSEATAGD